MSVPDEERRDAERTGELVRKKLHFRGTFV